MHQNSPSAPQADTGAILLHHRVNVWAAAAAVLSTDEQAPQAVRTAAEELISLGAGPTAIPSPTGFVSIRDSAVSAVLGADLQQAAAAVTAHGRWENMPDQALVAQGEMSARGARMVGPSLLPHLRGLQEALDGPAARMLDIGTGVGALAAYYAEQFPSLHVVGLDVSQRVLDLAHSRIRAKELTDRVSLVLGDISKLQSKANYDFVWFPAPFIPADTLEEGIRAAVRALKPGGWLLLGHQQTPDGAAAKAVMVFLNTIYGGSPMDGGAAASLLEGAGLIDLQHFAFAAPAPAFMAARKRW